MKLFLEKHKKLVEQIIRFAIVGGSAFLVEYVALIILTEWILPSIATQLSENQCALIAAPIAFTISTIYNYILSIKWVFARRTDTSGTQTFGIFVLLSMIALGLNEAFMALFMNIFAIHYLLAKLLSTFLVTIYNFISRKIFIEDHSAG